jgi:hypothetical protein
MEKMSGFEEVPELITEEGYIEMVVSYALSGGWVTENQKDLLIEKYLKPLYKHAQEILEDVKKNGLDDPSDLPRIIRKLNWCLEATRRIGSTESSNILKTITDYKQTLKSDEEEYAVSSFYEFAEGVLP